MLKTPGAQKLVYIQYLKGQRSGRGIDVDDDEVNEAVYKFLPDNPFALFIELKK